MQRMKKSEKRPTSGNVILMKQGQLHGILVDKGCETMTALCTAVAKTITPANVVVKMKYLRLILFDLHADNLK